MARSECNASVLADIADCVVHGNLRSLGAGSGITEEADRTDRGDELDRNTRCYQLGEIYGSPGGCIGRTTWASPADHHRYPGRQVCCSTGGNATWERIGGPCDAAGSGRAPSRISGNDLSKLPGFHRGVDRLLRGPSTGRL